jgi:phage-related protein
MTPMNMSEKQETKLRSLLTEEQYKDLMFLHEADTSAK